MGEDPVGDAKEDVRGRTPDCERSAFSLVDVEGRKEERTWTIRIIARLRHANPVKPAKLLSSTFSCRITSAFPSPSGSPLTVRRDPKMRERIRGKKRRGVARRDSLRFVSAVPGERERERTRWRRRRSRCGARRS